MSGGDAGADSAESEWDAAVDTAIIGICTTADDCVAVLNYRTGFECWEASGATKADVSRDPCLVPWKPYPTCTTSAPPPGCPSGLQPVTHSCFVTCRVIPVCTKGRCAINLGGQCDNVDAGPTQVDCEDLRTTYLNALAAAQQCDPVQSPARCSGSNLDVCGCAVPFDRYGLCANAVSSALADWQNANCPIVFPPCTKPCAVPSAAGATCVPNATGTAGTCAWQ
jgi:hypothetical protein